MRATRSQVAELMPGLLIGSAPSPQVRRTLARSGVSSVFDLRSEVTRSDKWPDGVRVVHAPLHDGGVPMPGEFRVMVRRIVDELLAGEVVLVHCQAGRGRSPTVAIGVLLEMGYGLWDAFRLVRTHLGSIALTWAQITGLQEYEAARGVASACHPLAGHDPGRQ